MRGFAQSVTAIVTALGTGRNAARYSSQARLQRSVRDVSTGLFDSAIFRELASDRLERGRVHRACTAVAVFEIELNEVAAVERTADALAHAIGESIRPSDLAARIGPLTFVALLDRCEREEAKHVCSRIMRSVLRAGVVGRLSCGIAVAPGDGISLDQLVSAATRRPAVMPAAERVLVAS